MFFEIINSLVAFIIVISLVVVTHEFGHYIIAKLLGIQVTDFSVGLGPKLFGFKDKSGTHWKLCAIPLGGYIKFYGDADAGSVTSVKKDISKSDYEKTFAKCSLWKRALVSVAGPMANFITSIIILAVIFSFVGINLPNGTKITSVKEGSQAEKAQLTTGDEIVAVNGKPTKTFNDLSEVFGTFKDSSMKVLINRDGKILEKTIVPQYFEDAAGTSHMGQLGFSIAFTKQKMGFGESILRATNFTFTLCVRILMFLKEMLLGQGDTKDLRSIISITKQSGTMMKKGIFDILFFIAIISINIGFINLLPIPPLDGGHILFCIVRGLCGERIADVFEKYATVVGIFIVIGLMLFGLVNDIIHFKSN